MYISDLYSGMTKDENLYGSKTVKLPAPRFLVFYNGVEKRPEKEILKLSDAYLVAEENPALELKAEFLNINPGNNEILLEMCKTLKDYSEYTHKVREYTKTMDISDAVEKAITECIREGILADFLKQNRAEAKKMSIYEYDEERQRKFDREEGREEGETRILTLIKKLIEDGRIDEVNRIGYDTQMKEALYKEYGI